MNCKPCQQRPDCNRCSILYELRLLRLLKTMGDAGICVHSATHVLKWCRGFHFYFPLFRFGEFRSVLASPRTSSTYLQMKCKVLVGCRFFLITVQSSEQYTISYYSGKHPYRSQNTPLQLCIITTKTRGQQYKHNPTSTTGQQHIYMAADL